MALIVSKIGDILRRRLDAEPSMPIVELCNYAGRHLTAMFPWEWLVRSPVTLTLSTGSNEVHLPPDFGRLDKIEATGSLLNSAMLTTPAHMLELEASIITVTGVGYWMTALWRKSVVDGTLEPVIRVYPTISSTGSVRVYYYAGWVDVASDNDVISIPPFMEAFYIETVWAFTAGYDEHDLGGLDVRLASLAASPLFSAARQLDGALQDELGELRNGVGSLDGSMYQSATIVGGPYRP